ncbi:MULTISPECIES: 4'-phosphopantetheinyl transferase family protein [Bacillus]|uniref:4'-phosphopantetheinyl transferase family protein n=1 Tax=Bacillus TaxID=1386 RepID=UPI000BF1A4E5|nr:4'-phosphopantetheinyl transferase superfamily protein [Bacillus wiedmannii]MCC2324139.1 4'-phosphopantetheinyl transferase superfamily protein [Bacillus wiedmannii]MCU5680698.1 4'-phosphopantetheinyl transferase superfamily protein [Bacillus wiedmannii]MED2839125.1 4'-phosphopantetheinyl transferase superfamily protein [Bacillus wiedmannii]PEM99334.1 hypothetical protein CN621_19820 [Bacillus wiedmannii]PFZ95506.1 hypothetical protein COL78_19005 [Bacillus wiedmannii]
MLELYLANILNMNKANYQRLYSVMDDFIKVKVDEMRKYEDRQRTILGNFLVKYFIAKKVNANIEDIKLEEDEFGKKKIVNHVGYCFNISHSGEWVFIGIAESEIGVDVEKIESLDFLNIASYFSKEEKEYLTKLDSKVLEMEFFRIWTAKESYIKYKGLGMVIPLESFSVPISENENFVKTLYEKESKEAFVTSSKINEEYYISVCGNSAMEQLELIYLDLKNEIGLSDYFSSMNDR